MISGRTIGTLAIAAGVTGVASGSIAEYLRRTNDVKGARTVDDLYQALANPLIDTLIAGAGVIMLKASHGGPMGAGFLGIGLGVLGGRMVSQKIDSALHHDEYSRDHSSAAAAVDTARAYFSHHGVPDKFNGPIDPAVDRTVFNAYYNPRKYIVGGESIVVGRDPWEGAGFGGAPDVLYHEYTHRMVQKYASGLSVGGGQAAAINESLADTFGCIIDDRNWTMGEDVIDGGLRSMENPGDPRYAVTIGGKKVNMPSTKAGYIETAVDNGGAHINMGIPSHAAYLIGSQIGREKLGNIYMDVIQHRLEGDKTFQDLADDVTASASALYGSNSHEAQVARDAWQQTGYDVTPPPTVAAQ